MILNLQRELRRRSKQFLHSSFKYLDFLTRLGNSLFYCEEITLIKEHHVSCKAEMLSLTPVEVISRLLMHISQFYIVGWECCITQTSQDARCLKKNHMQVKNPLPQIFNLYSLIQTFFPSLNKHMSCFMYAPWLGSDIMSAEDPWRFSGLSAPFSHSTMSLGISRRLICSLLAK